MVAAVCPRCRGVVAVHDGRPVVANSGAVERWHASCWAVRHARGVEQVTVIAPERSRKPAVVVGGAVAGIALVGVTLAASMLRVELPAASLATINFETSESLALGARSIEHEAPPPTIDLRAVHPVPVAYGTPLDELYPSLVDWIHPVTNAEQALSKFPTGLFGAERDGVHRRECGRGHCGVDLDGPIGRPIVAVADGVVVHVERSKLGRDGRSGRYVRMEHPDGSLTAYMHMSSIARGLEVGDHVDAGQQIGTLGATGVNAAAPHLHFALEVPNVPGTHGDHKHTHYVDPAPFLVRASIAPAPDRRRAIKPAL